MMILITLDRNIPFLDCSDWEKKKKKIIKMKKYKSLFQNVKEQIFPIFDYAFFLSQNQNNNKNKIKIYFNKIHGFLIN